MRVTRLTGVVSGFLIIVLGVWGGLIPFVGPYFDYSFGANTTWHYTMDRLWLCIVPGAVAVLGGLLLVAGRSRGTRLFGATLGLLAGAWFAVGPAVSLTWESGSGPIGQPLYGTVRQMFELIGYFYGLGVVIAALAAFATGRLLSEPQLAGEETSAAPAPGERAAAPAPGEPPATTPTEPERLPPARDRRLGL